MTGTTRRPPKPPPDEPILCPFVILVDGREKAPYHFDGITADADIDHRLVVIKTRWARLRTGDYTIEGFEDRIAIERKSLEDLFGTLGQGRDRFRAELERLNGMDAAAVVVEAGWSEILEDPPAWSKLPPKTVFRSIISWQQRFPRVHWWMMPDRRLAEITTFRILEKYYAHRDD